MTQEKEYTMQIKQVKICNFSSYVGENTIDLTTSGKQNIVLIGGNNGTGKTSLFTAIKLALYGPQCFRFQDKNNQYTARIKELINHDTFMKQDINAFVEVEIIMPTDRESTLYTLRREWNYSEKKLSEAYTVFNEGRPLDIKDQDFFQNYLFSVIPPNMFDFFFFDGEEIADFFSSASYNNYIKNAVLTLCGYDTFQLIKKFCDSYVSDEAGDGKYDQVRKNLETSEQICTTLSNEITQLENRIPKLNEAIENLKNEKEALQLTFENSGGLSEKKRDEIKKQQQEQDTIKVNSSKKVRDFAESLMPIFITRDIAHAVEAQLKDEEKVHRYQAVTQQLSEEIFYQILMGLPKSQQVLKPKKLAETLSLKIVEGLRPTVNLDDFLDIHNFSQEQESHIISALVQLKEFNPRNIIDACENKSKAIDKYEQLSRQLRESLPEVDAHTYFSKISTLVSDMAQYANTKETVQLRLETACKELEKEQKQYELLKEKLKAISRNQTAYMYTDRIGQMMQALIHDAAHSKFKQVEELTLKMFQQIIHKNDFIDLIELDDNFNINIYKTQTYTARELAILLQNIGVDEFFKRLGTAGVQKALRHFHLETAQELKSYLIKRHLTGSQMNITDNEPVQLYKRMELNQLSKGEKQVFILSLYWAIIKTSGQTIPFVIDTPYARIDTEHRGQIAKLFFPEISDQVIILSTDEEVVGRYKAALAPYISHEYLLDFDTQKGQTILKSGYFEEVAT